MSSFYDLASLVMIPSGKKAGKVYSQKPLTTDGQLAFTRASTATRIGPDGKIEKTRTNLLLQSNQFDTTWGLSSATLTSGQSGYDGTSDAWLLDSSSEGYCFQFLSPGNVGTLSIFAKANSVNNLRLRTFGPSVNADGFFDLINGVVGSSTNLIDSSIQSIGSGWYRCSIVYNNTPSLIRIYPSASSSSSSGTSGSIYIQDGQIEQSLVATNYIETTTAAVSVGSVDNMPRLNYTLGSTTSCPSLLLEPQRTNLETKSEYFEGWSLVSNITRTTNYATSPDGSQNASRLQFTANGFLGNIITSSGTEYTLSCFAKRNDSGSQSFGFFKDGSGVVNSEMTLTSNWQRFEYTYTAAASSYVGLSALSGADVSVFGYQIEAASYATSYIPTFGATVTRTQDNCNKASISGLIGQTAGTVFFDWVMNHESISTSEDFYSLTLSDGTANKMIAINNYNNAIAVFIKEVSTQFYDNSFSGSDGLNIKLALAYANNDVALYINGNQIATDTSASIPTLNQINLNAYYNNLYADSSSVKNLMLFKTRLTNTQLAELTSTDS